MIDHAIKISVDDSFPQDSKRESWKQKKKNKEAEWFNIP